MSADAPTKPPRPIPGVPVRRLPQGGLGGAVPRLPPLPGDLVAGLTEARPEAGGAEEKGDSPVPSGPGFELKVRKPAEVGKAILEIAKAIGIIAALVMSGANAVQKEEVSTVDNVEAKVENIERRVDGRSDQKGASADGESLSERVGALEKSVRPMVANQCARDQWLGQVLARLDPPVIVRVEGCAAPVPIRVTEEPALPGRRGRGATVINSPMPRAE
jgi:hypothetical protein